MRVITKRPAIPPPPLNQGGYDGGLTLIEVLVAVTILVVVAVALLETIQTSMKSSRNNRDLAKAVYLTKSRMASLEAQYSRKPYVPTGTNNGNYGDDYEGYRWETEAEEDRKEESWYLTARTYWGKDASGHERQFVLTTIVPRYKEHPDQDLRKSRRAERGTQRSGAHSRSSRERGPGGRR